MPTVHDMRLGHALRGGTDAVEEAVAIASGSRPLLPRDPADLNAVTTAEEVLGISPDARPIYAYLGDLHPGLGTVGLVIERGWLRSLTGVTKCDSGGLGGRRGTFAALDPVEVADALRMLTFSAASIDSWGPEFADEVGASYVNGPTGYVTGDEPDTTSWQDARGKCFVRSTRPRDRRLWTWEARFDQGPAPQDVVALALSEGAFKMLEDLHRQGLEVPESVRIFRGSSSSEGSHFHEPKVRTMLAGGA
jgi:hypothetical protein